MDDENAQSILEAALRELDSILNRGEWKEGLEIARELQQHDPICAASAQVWFRVALCQLQMGQPTAAQRAQELAARCGDYSLVTEGDFFRDRAIWFLREHQMPRARSYIAKARRRHEGHPNRSICLDGVEGRVFMREGIPAVALSFALKADKAWEALGDEANRLWQTNNLLHLLAAARVLAVELAAGPDARSEHEEMIPGLVGRIFATDQNLSRKGAARRIAAATSRLQVMRLLEPF